MIKTIIYGTTGIGIVVLAYNILYAPAYAISNAFSSVGAPDNILNHAKLSFALAFIGLFAVIVIFMLLRATRKEYEVQQY